jgi:hypothetical protein
MVTAPRTAPAAALKVQQHRPLTLQAMAAIAREKSRGRPDLGNDARVPAWGFVIGKRVRVRGGHLKTSFDRSGGQRRVKALALADALG